MHLKIHNNSAFLFLSMIFIGFWPLFYTFGPDAMMELTSSLVLGVSVAVMLTWLPTAVRCLRTGLREGESLFSVGTFFFATAIAVQRLWSTAYRWDGRPDWMLNSPFSSLAWWMVFCAGTMVLLAPGTSAGAVPQRNWVYVACAASFGSLIAGITIGMFIIRL